MTGGDKSLCKFICNICIYRWTYIYIICICIDVYVVSSDGGDDPGQARPRPRPPHPRGSLRGGGVLPDLWMRRDIPNFRSALYDFRMSRRIFEGLSPPLNAARHFRSPPGLSLAGLKIASTVPKVKNARLRRGLARTVCPSRIFASMSTRGAARGARGRTCFLGSSSARGVWARARGCGRAARGARGQDMELMQFGTLKILLNQQIGAEAELGHLRKGLSALEARLDHLPPPPPAASAANRPDDEDDSERRGRQGDRAVRRVAAHGAAARLWLGRVGSWAGCAGTGPTARCGVMCCDSLAAILENLK